MEDLKLLRLLRVFLTLELLSLCNGTEPSADRECPVEITPNSMMVQYRERTQTVTCKPTSSSRSHLKEIYWQRGDIKTYSESLDISSYGDWDSQPVCHASFVGLGRCSKALNFTLFKTPDKVFILADKDYSSLTAGQNLELRCIVTEVAPAPNVVVQWYQGNDTFEPTATGSIQQIDCKNGKNCDISEIRYPITLFSAINITLDRNHNGVEFKCRAQMDLGPRLPIEMFSRPLNITVHYKPTINETKLPKIIPVFSGYPEELVCEADGYPPPEIQWSSDKGNRVPGATIFVTKAGLYNCTATNEVDSVFHEVEVILKEDYLPLIAGFVAITVIAISVVFCFIYSIYYKNTKMRRYSLKNPKLSTQNGNVAHNGWDLQFPMTKLS